MEAEIKAWFYNILNAIHEIDSFFTDTPKEFTAFQNDLKTRRAVERNIEIIGEAIKRILEKDSSVVLTNSRKIVDTRKMTSSGQ